MKAIVCCESVRRLTSKSVYSEISERSERNNQNEEGEEGAEIWSQDGTNSDQIQETAETSCHHMLSHVDFERDKHRF